MYSPNVVLVHTMDFLQVYAKEKVLIVNLKKLNYNTLNLVCNELNCPQIEGTHKIPILCESRKSAEVNITNHNINKYKGKMVKDGENRHGTQG